MEQSKGGMKNIPPKIYLQVYEDVFDDFKELHEVSWCADRIFPTDIEYVLPSSITPVNSKEDGKDYKKLSEEISLEWFKCNEELNELKARSNSKEDWIKCEDRPLFKHTNLGWECTEDGDKEFLAAVQYEDKTRPGEKLWWIRHCIFEDGTGLCVVGDDENTPAGWDMNCVTHWQPLPSPPKK